MEDEDGALLERQPPEGPLELVAIVDGEDSPAAPSRSSRWQDPDVRRPATATPGLGVALVGQDPMEPGLEPIGVSQRPQLTPRHDERSLHCIFGEIGVAQDPRRDRHASVADHASQGVEGLAIALLRAVHE